MGSSAIVVCHDDVAPKRHRLLLAELAAAVENSKHQFEPDFIDASDAVRQAANLPGTTCLLDMGDNVGGGAPADGTIVAHQLHRQRIGPTFVCLFDRTAIARLDDLQIGDVTMLAVGGKTDALHGAPLVAEVRIKSRHEGRFREIEPRHGGFCDFDQGETVIVETIDSQITIMLTARRMPPFSLAQLTSCGVEPARFRAIVAKGVIAPMAAYAPVVDRFIHANTPGVTCADMTQMEYKHRRRPMFPFETI